MDGWGKVRYGDNNTVLHRSKSIVVHSTVAKVCIISWKGRGKKKKRRESVQVVMAISGVIFTDQGALQSCRRTGGKSRRKTRRSKIGYGVLRRVHRGFRQASGIGVIDT